MKLHIAIATAIAAGALGSAQFAAAAEPEKATPPATPVKEVQVEPVSRLDRHREVCKKVVYTGSRLGGAKICKTQEEWDAISHRYRKTTEDQQNRLWTGPISR